MSSVLSDQWSSEMHLGYAKTNAKLSIMLEGGDELVSKMIPYYSALMGVKELITSIANKKKEACEKMKKNKANLYRIIVKVYELSKQYDSNNIGKHSHEALFVNKESGNIITSYELRDLKTVSIIIDNLLAMGDDHKLFINVPKLQMELIKYNKNLLLVEKCDLQLYDVKSEEALAKSNLCNQLKKNYKRAVSLYGKLVADELFTGHFKPNPISIKEKALA
jgi:hypothetical protein